MAAISYSITAGGTLQTITAGTSAPGSGQVELRIDQGNSVVDGGTGPRPLKRGEAQTLLRILEEYLVTDPNVNQ